MHYGLLSILLLTAAPDASLAQDADERAKTLAQEILDRGAVLFDKRDAPAMAATYVDGAQIVIVKRASDSGRVEFQTAQGRAAIEKAYADVFKDRLPEHKSRNTVETARFLGPNMLLIHGRFALNRDQGDAIQFVQIRARENDEWRIASLQLMPLPEQNP